MNRTARETVEAYRACPLVPKRGEVAEQGTRDAIDLAMAVRDLDPREVWGQLAIWARDNPNRLFAATVALAAMVPVDVRPSELLAWTFELKGVA